MRAMIFAAGLGTRLKPFTLSHPKALVPVGGVPMLQRVILKLKDCGVTEIVVNVHHFADQIISFLKDNSNFGLDIRISDERRLLLDTGGGILAAEHLFTPSDEPIMVHNADILTDFSIPQMLEAHNASDALATLLVSVRHTSRYLLFGSDNMMQGWTNESTGQVLPAGLDAEGLRKAAFAGVHIISPKVFPLLRQYAQKTGEVFSIIPFYVEACAASPICGYAQEAPYMWHDIGKPESLEAAQAEFFR